MRTSPLKLVALAASVIIIASCGSNQNPSTDAASQPDMAEVEQEMTKEDLAQADAMIKEMPSPIEMAILVKHAGGEYNPDLLNDVKNIDNYLTNGKKDGEHRGL